ncbi:enoyl-CoA hydratase-related protein [Burkholderia sp. BCC0322]|uniref:enoyl-CoA hydratase-related protein n=1 Tax=unclassified Burkholderia TaxID=2613784 RepID=UPI00158EB129|nr:enoyl-CoA hydratase-related protein [Burkholderia sp. BCC0322]
MDGLKTLAVTVDARGIATVALQRGDVLNAFDETMIAELTDAFTTLGWRDDVRAIVLRSDGRAFCAGADLQWMQRASANDAEANLRDAQRFAAMMRAIRQCPKPTVARVQGHAFGGGVGLCAACDIVIASDHARFSVSEARFGILPAVIGPYLVEAVGQRQARRLALTATQLAAGEAVAIGLIHQAVPLDSLDEALDKTLAELGRNGPNALMEIKRFFDAIGEYPPSDERAAFTAQTISRVRATPEAKEGFTAFFAKRPPAWEAGAE